MKNVWVGVVVSLALACPVAYAVEEMMPEEGPQAQEMAKPAKQAAAHRKHKKRHKRHHDAKKHHQHHKHHAKKHQMAPEGQETPAEQKIDEETDLNNSRR